MKTWILSFALMGVFASGVTASADVYRSGCCRGMCKCRVADTIEEDFRKGLLEAQSADPSLRFKLNEEGTQADEPGHTAHCDELLSELHLRLQARADETCGGSARRASAFSGQCFRPEMNRHPLPYVFASVGAEYSCVRAGG